MKSVVDHLVEENDLAAVRPDLAAEWDSAKNDLSPRQVSLGCKTPVWWRCPMGHAYMQQVFARAAGIGCPYCAGPESGDHPAGADALHRGSRKIAWWLCPIGHG